MPPSPAASEATQRIALWGLLLLLFAAPSATAQTTSCEARLIWAHEHYVDQRFSEAEASARACLAQPNVDADAAIEAHRLLALIHLRQDDLAEAKREVIKLLSISFDYAPDPILDPPTYAALVEAVRNQLRVDPEAPRQPSPAAPQPEPPADDAIVDVAPGAPTGARTPLRAARGIHLGFTLGAGSYSGERGVDAASLVGEFNENGGVSLAIDGTYHVRAALAVAASYRAARFPLLLTNDVRPEDVQVRPDDSSEWVHTVSVLGRALYRPDQQVAPYVQLGAGGVVSYLNSTLRLAAGPQFGLGIDVAATPRLAGFAEFNLLVAIPGDAVDRVNANDALGDLLTFAGVGLRYRLEFP
jgi:hypothetical protein